MNPLTTNPTPSQGQQGLSLVELMISLTIGLILLLGLTTLMVRQASTRDELEKSSREIENGRYAMQLLHDDIEHAGFYGTYFVPSGVAFTQPADPCVVTPGAANSGWDSTTAPVSVPVAVYGFPGAAANPLTASTCGLTNYRPNTAILVVRRTATTTVAAGAAAAGTSYLQVSGCNTDNATFNYGTAGSFSRLQRDCTNPALLYPYLVNIYYISSCGDDCTTPDNIPTLKMVQAGPTAAPSTPIPLAEGIEDMQFDYGIDNSGTGAPDILTTTPTAAQWPNVVAVRVNLLARNVECTTGYQDPKTYVLGQTPPASAAARTTCTNGDYKRRVFTELVRAVNPSSRRE